MKRRATVEAEVRGHRVKASRQERRKEDRDKPGSDAPELYAAGFKHEEGGVWSRDGTFFGKEAALQKAWDERARRHESGNISDKDAN